MKTAEDLFVSGGYKPGQPVDDKKIALADEQGLAAEQLPLWGASSAIPAEIGAQRCGQSIRSKRLVGYVYRQGGRISGARKVAYSAGWVPVYVKESE